MTTVTVYWYSSASWLGRLVRAVTRSRYSHVAIGADVDSIAGPVPALWEALGSGIVKRVGMEAYTRSQEAVAHRALSMSREDAQQVIAFMDRNVADGYSVTGFIAAGLGALTGWRWKIALDGTWICSGFVASALTRCGREFDHDPETMTPEDLARELGVDA